MEPLILRGLPPSVIDELIKYYKWFPDLTIQKSSKMINDILKKRHRNVIIPDFIEFNNELMVVSERYTAKGETIYTPNLYYKVFLWYLYHRFVEGYNYLKDPERNR